MRVAPETAEPPAQKMHWTARWWKYRAVHRMFGFKFWAIVVGAAPLDPELEAFWGRLGFVVIQGYGLTETAPIVTLNHPFHATKGAVGKPIAGVEIKIADDGEILVRGENVTRGYFNAPEETRVAFRDGWFHTGDVGELDATGQLRIRGRKKEMIVTPEGLNVFPEDVEQALERPTRRARVGGRRRVESPGPPPNACTPCSSSSRAPTWTTSCAAPTSSSAIIRRCAPRRCGRRASCRARKARGSSSGASSSPGSRASTAGRRPASGRAGTHRRVGPRPLRARTDAGPRNHDRRARAELARTRRADDGARGSVSGHGRRSSIQRRQNRRRPRRADPAARGRGSGDARRDRGHRVPVVEPIAPRPRPAPRQPPDVDPPARPHLRARRGPRARSPRAAGRAPSSSPPITRATSTRR